MRSLDPPGSAAGVVPLGLTLLSLSRVGPTTVGDAVKLVSAPAPVKLLASTVTV